MYKVGITGGIGSGKSTVAALLKERGVAVYDSDSRAKSLMACDVTLRERLIERFGAECYAGAELNRGWLADKVFSNREALENLNAIVHPAVMDDFDSWAEEQDGDYVVLESAILFEAGLQDRVDVVVSVMAPRDLRIERAMARDGASREKIEERINNQMSDDERADRSKYVVVNIVLDDLDEDVEQLHRRLSYDAHAQHH